MSNQASTPLPGSAKSSPDGRLDSWKEIADYLDREVRTVQRWEKTENLPVHRHEHQKKSTVYAYTSELAEWRKNRQPKDDPEADAAFVPDPDVVIPVETGDGDATPAIVESSPTERAGPSPRLWKWLGVLAAAVLVFFLGHRAYRWFRPATSSMTVSAETAPIETVPVQRKVRLIVLPFKNLSNDPKQDYFSAGLTDEMITRLSNLEPQYLGIIAATSSNAFAGKPISEIRRALDVQYVLEGSVRRQGKRVRIDAQLIQVSDQTHLWADKYDRDLNDILQVQDDVATAVADRIRTALDIGLNYIAVTETPRSETNVQPHPFSAEAYDAYLRGRFYWTNRGDLHKSIEAYQQAIQRDSHYALAYAGLASTYALLGQVPYDDLAPSDAKPKAREAAKRALDLDPDLAEAHAVLGNVAFSYDWDFEKAELEFQSAIALGPNNPTSHHWYGHYFMMRNHLPQALEQNSLTLELDPVSPLFNTTRAEMKYHMRDYDAAIEQGRRTIEQYPTYLSSAKNPYAMNL
jgi:TolB-like protein/Tfp pilus assembly protein PilF